MRERDGAQAVYAVRAEDAGDLAAIVERIGADPRAFRYLAPKRRTLCLLAPGVDYRAASFLKQELLSRGGDAAVAKHVIDGRAERSDVLLMGTDSQLSRLLQKLEAMDCWGLRELREALGRALNNAAVREWSLPLPGGRTLALGGGAKVMGILNLTPDSFYAPSRAVLPGGVVEEKDLLARAEAMLEAGAEVLDLGAESTRPRAEPLDEVQERARLLPALTLLRREFPRAVLSVDTYKGEVALAAAGEGADIINDIGGGMGTMLDCAARTGLPYVLTHFGAPAGETPHYDDLFTDVHLYFLERLHAAEAAGLSRDRVILDPGLGFGKAGRDNLRLLKEIEGLRALGRPILAGHSRKGFIGEATGAGTPLDAKERLPGTLALSALLEGQVELIRVHDVAPNRQALLMARAVREAKSW